MYSLTSLFRSFAYFFFFFNDTATTEIYTLSLHDALPIYRILIVEDELIWAERLASMVKNLGHYVVDIRKSFLASMDAFKKTAYDLVLLDINLEGEDEGILLGKYLMGINKPFIYVTSYADIRTLTKAKATLPGAYIIKPFNQNDLFINLEIMMERFNITGNINSTFKKLTLSDGHDIVHLQTNEIIYINSDNNYCDITTIEKKITTRKNYQPIA